MSEIKPIRTGLLSFGMSGRLFHAPFLKVSPRFDFSAVWERTKNEAVKFYPEVGVYRSLGEMLNNDQTELVIVNTPNFTHFDFARQALRAGKHVVVEKPFTITVSEGLQLIRLAEKQHRVLTVYQNRRYDSDYRTVKNILNTGRLGSLKEMSMYFDRFKLQPSKKLHKETPGPGTGNLYDLGSHVIDQAIQLFGMPQRIFADIDILRETSRVDDYFELILFYPRMRVQIHSSYVALAPIPGYILHGTAGTFSKPRTNIQEERLTAGETPDSPDWGQEPEHEYGTLTTLSNGRISSEKIVSERGNYMDFYDGLYSAIREDASVPVNPLDAVRVVHLIERACESSHTGKVVEVTDI